MTFLPTPFQKQRATGDLQDAAQRVEKALQALRSGGFAIVVEDLHASKAVFAVLAAQYATPAAVNTLATHARGVLCVTMTSARANHLNCQAIDRKRTASATPKYGVSVEAAVGVSTGISAGDRSETIGKLADSRAKAQDFVRPGHIMPIIVADRGVVDAAYGPEAAHDLVTLAGLAAGSALSHVLDEIDGLSSENAQLFADSHGWPLVHVSEVLHYRAAHERLVRIVAEGVVDTVQGPFTIRVYENEIDGTSHIALLCQTAPRSDVAPLIRLHSQCLTGDILHSRRCDCGAQLHESMRQISESGHGAILYLRQEGRGIGLIDKIRAYSLQDHGADTVDANVQLGFAPDERDYAGAAQILRDLAMTRVRVLTNNPQKLWALSRLGIEVVARQSIEISSTPDNIRYLQTKRDRMGHWIGGVAELDRDAPNASIASTTTPKA